MNEVKELVEELRNKKSRDNRDLLDRSADMIERLAKELCEKSGCHHKCHDTSDCVVEDEALLLINENKSNNFDVKSNNEIEEMAFNICGLGLFCFECNNRGKCKAKKYAERAYNAGYRKQSDGEWIDRYKGKYANSLYVCSICDGKSLLANHMNELLTPTVKQILTPYCPHCGAKMKGGE